jgi:thiol:disulfide interchange protein DsbD
MRTGGRFSSVLGMALAVAVIGSWATTGSAEPKSLQAGSPLQADTVRWTVHVVPEHPKPGDALEIVFTADIPSGWILYSSDFSADIGPRPARFSFDATPGVDLVEGVRAIKSLRRKDKTWNTAYRYFEGRAEFRQRAKLTAPVQAIAGRIDGQTCFEESGLCKLFHETFAANLD